MPVHQLSNLRADLLLCYWPACKVVTSTECTKSQSPWFASGWQPQLASQPQPPHPHSHAATGPPDHKTNLNRLSWPQPRPPAARPRPLAIRPAGHRPAGQPATVPGQPATRPASRPATRPRCHPRPPFHSHGPATATHKKNIYPRTLAPKFGNSPQISTVPNVP